jgi:hypothetical protein
MNARLPGFQVRPPDRPVAAHRPEVLLTGAALIRERERGTVEHLLVMPMGLVVLAASALSVKFAVEVLLAVPLHGSVALFVCGTALHLFAVTSLGGDFQHVPDHGEVDLRAKLRSTPPDIYVEVETVDIRVLEFHKADRIIGQATRAKDDFKHEVERRLLAQMEAVIAR